MPAHRPRFRPALSVAALLIALFGAQQAHAALFDDEEARRQISDLSIKMNERVDTLSRAQIELVNQIQSLREENARLRGQVETLQYELESAKKRQQDFYVDLVFYNYLLKCFVLIDLKIGQLTHQDIGQMDMYVRMYDDLRRNEGDNPTVGILLCGGKDQSVVRYSVLHESEQLFASKYRLVLPSEEVLRREIEREQALLAIKDEPELD